MFAGALRVVFGVVVNNAVHCGGRIGGVAWSLNWLLPAGAECIGIDGSMK